MVTVLSCGPDFSVEVNVTLITRVPFGRIGSFGYSGTVQPHEPTAVLMIRGSLPLFENLNSWVTDSPCLMVPKLYSSSSNFITGPFGRSTPEVVGACAFTVSTAIAKRGRRSNFFIIVNFWIVFKVLLSDKCITNRAI